MKKTLAFLPLLLCASAVQASGMDSETMSKLLSQLPSKQLNQLCSSSSDDQVSQLCAKQVSTLRDRLLEQPQLNVETMQSQATEMFNGRILPLINKLQGGASGSKLPPSE